MGGKGRRRRQKNYVAAHGGFSHLPPPPVPSAIDAMPSKLRKIISLTSRSSSSSRGFAKVSINEKKMKKVGSRVGLKHDLESANSGMEECLGNRAVGSQDIDIFNGTKHNSATNEKKKRRRERKQIKDLRFETEMIELGLKSKRKERKKRYLEEKKKKRKKSKTEDNMEFFRHEEIRFGEVVEAPPKLATLPKAKAKGPKTVQSASKERLRIQAIEDYRKRKGGGSGIEAWNPPSSFAPATKRKLGVNNNYIGKEKEKMKYVSSSQVTVMSD